MRRVERDFWRGTEGRIRDSGRTYSGYSTVASRDRGPQVFCPSARLPVASLSGDRFAKGSACWLLLLTAQENGRCEHSTSSARSPSDRAEEAQPSSCWKRVGGCSLVLSLLVWLLFASIAATERLLGFGRGVCCLSCVCMSNTLVHPCMGIIRMPGRMAGW